MAVTNGDVDTALLARNPDTTTVLAANANAFMARHPEARAAYAQLWGVAWVALGNGVQINDSADSIAVTAA